MLPRSVKKLSTAREIGAYPFLEQKLIEWFREQRKKKISVKRYRLKLMEKRLARNNHSKPFKQYYQEEWNLWMDDPNPIFTKSGNRQKPSYHGKHLYDKVGNSS